MTSKGVTQSQMGWILRCPELTAGGGWVAIVKNAPRDSNLTATKANASA